MGVEQTQTMTPSTRIPPSTKRNAQDLRGNPTDAERALRRYLRQSRVTGLKFRRQHPIGRCILNFVCLEARLVVELDDGQHADRQVDDQERAAWLEARGYRVLSFRNTEVFGNPEGLLEVILRAVAGSGAQPTSYPSPCQGKGPHSPLPMAGGREIKKKPRPRRDEALVELAGRPNAGPPFPPGSQWGKPPTGFLAVQQRSGQSPGLRQSRNPPFTPTDTES